MKKTLIALAALAATASFAQSTVTISGIVDVGVKSVSNVAPGAAKLSVGSGNNNRIAFGVTEDLGGGLKALANAQMRFDPASGTTEGSNNRPLFQGETRIGVSGGFGTVMLGRGLTALQLPNGGNSDPWGVSTVAGSVYAAGFATDYAYGGEGRIDGGVWYTSPSLNGLTISASYSPKTVALTSGFSGKSTSVNALYTNGPLVVGLGNEENRAGDTITQLYGNYDLGVAKVFASNATVKGGTTAERAGLTLNATSAAVPTGGAATQVAAGGKITNNTVGVTVPMGAISLRAGYSVWNGNGAPGQKDDNKLGFGVKYDLSKRTYIYSDVASQTRKNNSAGVSPATNNSKVSSFDLGVAHSF